MFCACAGNAFIGIDLYELPVGSLLDVFGIVIDLRLIACKLLICVGGDSCIGCDPSFMPTEVCCAENFGIVAGIVVIDFFAISVTLLSLFLAFPLSNSQIENDSPSDEWIPCRPPR